MAPSSPPRSDARRPSTSTAPKTSRPSISISDSKADDPKAGEGGVARTQRERVASLVKKYEESAALPSPSAASSSSALLGGSSPRSPILMPVPRGKEREKEAFSPKITSAETASPLLIPGPSSAKASRTSREKDNDIAGESSKAASVSPEVVTERVPMAAKAPQMMKIHNAPTLVNPSVRPVNALGRGHAANLPIELMPSAPSDRAGAGPSKARDEHRGDGSARSPPPTGHDGKERIPSGKRSSEQPLRDGGKNSKGQKDKRGSLPSRWLDDKEDTQAPIPSPPQSGGGTIHAPSGSKRPTSPYYNHTPTTPAPSRRESANPFEDPTVKLPPPNRHAVDSMPGTPLSDAPSRNPLSTIHPSRGTVHFPKPPESDSEDDSIATPSSSFVKPIPAADVFAVDAMPLYLPALERYLSNEELFSEPLFSDPKVLATETERALFDYGNDDGSDDDDDHMTIKPDKKRKSGRKGARMEAAGGQFAIPKPAIRSSRKEKAFQADEGVEEAWNVDAGKEEADADGAKTALLGQPPALVRSETADTNISAGVPSALSSASSPMTRKSMFPPLMLLQDTRLRELKSNAVGPRAPPGGLLGAMPGLGSLLGTIIDFTIGVEGSSFAAGLMSFELFRDFAQIWANNLHFKDSPAVQPDTNFVTHLIFVTLPNILALDFVSVFGKAVVFFLLWMGITACTLYCFYRMTKQYDPNREIEGYDSQPYIFHSPKRGTKVSNILIVFTLTALYIPLTKLSIDALTWQAAWWPVANPYSSTNDTTPVLPPLGDPHLYRDPLDFCWTTTMRKDEFNFAWLIVPLAALCVIFYTIWFPFRMFMVIKDMLPSVSEYNELGRKRSKAEMEVEYYRLMNKDKSPLNFMYNAYRRRWGFCELCDHADLRCQSTKLTLPLLSDKPLYIVFFKFSNTLVISLFTKNNCLFRSKDSTTMLVSQQIVLIVLMAVLLCGYSRCSSLPRLALMSYCVVIHISISPFVDAISNRSELISRVGYVATAIIGLLGECDERLSLESGADLGPLQLR